MSQANPPTRVQLGALIDGTLGEAERLRIEGLLEDNPQWLGEVEDVVGFEDFRGSYLADAPPEVPVQPELLVDLIGKLKAGDFSATAPERIPEYLDEPLGEDGKPGRIGDYEVHELIAQGGMGLVFKGRDPNLQRDVAIKVLSPSLAAHPVARDLFLNEARAAAALDHPNVLPIYAVHPGHQVPYFVMPFIEGPTLSEYVADGGQLAPRRAAVIGEKVARALAAAHEIGLVHRDIKPANILLEDGGTRVLVADFGIASAAGEERRVISGTPEFMAPEQERGEAATPAADLFALGKVIDYCAEEKRPGWLKGLVENLTEEDAEKRPDSAAQVADGLRRRVRPKAVPLVAAALLLGAALVVAGIVSRPSAPVDLDPISIEGTEARYLDLSAAINAAPAGAVILIEGTDRYELSGIELDQALTLRAAPGAHPVFVQVDISVAMIRSTAPLAIEGITLHRDIVGSKAEPFIAIEGETLMLRHATIFGGQGDGTFFERPGLIELSGGATLDAEDTMFGSHRSNIINFEPTPEGNQTGTMTLKLSNCMIGAGFLTCFNGGAERLVFELENSIASGRTLWIANPRFALPEVEFRVRRSVMLMNTAMLWMPTRRDHWESGEVTWQGEDNVYPGSGNYLRFSMARAFGHTPDSPATLGEWEALDQVEDTGGEIVDHVVMGFELGDLDAIRRAGKKWLREMVAPKIAQWPERGVDVDRLKF